MEISFVRSSDQPTRFTDLDGVRGLLAILVMLYHYGLNSVIVRASHGWVRPAPWGLCVDFFFILSGFVLCFSFSRKPPSLKDYARKRVLRLLPVHLAILLLFLPVFIHKGLPDPLAIALNIPLLQSMVFLPPINGPSWSASYELVIPGFIAVLFPAFLRLPRPALIALLAGLVGVEGYIAYLNVELENPALARAIVGLSIGFCLFRLYGDRIQQSTSARSSGLTVAMVMATLAVLVASGFVPALAFLFPLVAIATIMIGARSIGLLSRQPFWWIGGCSYTIYMIHLPMLFTFQAIFGARFEGSILLKGLALAACLAGAGLLTRYVERPFIRMRRFGPWRLRPEPG